MSYQYITTETAGACPAGHDEPAGGLQRRACRHAQRDGRVLGCLRRRSRPLGRGADRRGRQGVLRRQRPEGDRTRRPQGEDDGDGLCRPVLALRPGKADHRRGQRLRHGRRVRNRAQLRHHPCVGEREIRPARGQGRLLRRRLRRAAPVALCRPARGAGHHVHRPHHRRRRGAGAGLRQRGPSAGPS